MNLRKEPVVLAATLVCVGLMAYSTLGTKAPAARRSGSNKPTLPEQRVPDASLARPAERDLGQLSRDLFSPPRDTHPLPPLDAAPAPLAPLKGLFPPPLPGPLAAHFGQWLREDATPTPVAGLFATDAGAEDRGPADELGDAGLEQIKGLGYTAGPSKPAAAQEALTSEERAAQIAGYKRLYDWLRLDEGSPLFGRIRNKDKFALKTRREEAVEFLEFDPATGLERYAGQAPIQYERSRVTEFHFAETVPNRLQERRREIGDKVTPGQYPSLMQFAEACVASRNEAREALDLALEVYRLADSVSPADPAPHLGIARCHELKFEFEAAFAEMSALTAKYGEVPEVQVRLGELEARLRLFGSAEQRFQGALVGANQDFEAQAAYGRFLLARGRAAEALEHLEIAHRNEPSADDREGRLRIRLELAAARFADGKLDGPNGAAAMYDSALAVEANDSRALAGKLALAAVKRQPADAALETAAAAARDQAGFELLLAQGLTDLRAKRWSIARDNLLAAAEADPLRAFAAWRALSWLAEVTGYPVEALRYVEQALEAAPDDPWSLYQHGRLLWQRDDPEGAARQFKAALDRELSFTDAIASLAEIAVGAEEFAEAELYLGRALELDPERAELEARRGYNFVRLNDTARAEACFKRAQDLDAAEPAARSGLAWCAYRRNDPARAIELFRGLNDARRALPDKDAWRVYALSEIKRVEDHVAKEAWDDNFERSGNAGSNSWDVEEAAGPTFALADGRLFLRGNFKQTDGRARLLRRYPATEFVSIEMDVKVSSATFARVGVFITRERQQRGSAQPTSQISVERHPEGGLQLLLMDRATAEPERTDVAPALGVEWWPADKVVRLRIERLGDGSDSKGRISVDGIPVAGGFPMGSIGSTGEVNVGLFALGDTGQKVELEVDNVQVVRRRAR